jgi:molybdenum cofactor biosynthesis enzyme
MIDVSSKPNTLRRAIAQAILSARPETVERIKES